LEYGTDKVLTLNNQKGNTVFSNIQAELPVPSFLTKLMINRFISPYIE